MSCSGEFQELLPFLNNELISSNYSFKYNEMDVISEKIMKMPILLLSGLARLKAELKIKSPIVLMQN